MPRMDKTGPLGTGPIGRGMGPCSGGVSNQPVGRMGMGMGAGRGRGFRQGGRFGWSGAQTPFSQEDEKGILEMQKTWLEKQLSAITQRIKGLEENQE